MLTQLLDSEKLVFSVFLETFVECTVFTTHSSNSPMLVQQTTLSGFNIHASLIRIY